MKVSLGAPGLIRAWRRRRAVWGGVRRVSRAVTTNREGGAERAEDYSAYLVVARAQTPPPGGARSQAGLGELHLRRRGRPRGHCWVPRSHLPLPLGAGLPGPRPAARVPGPRPVLRPRPAPVRGPALEFQSPGASALRPTRVSRQQARAGGGGGAAPSTGAQECERRRRGGNCSCASGLPAASPRAADPRLLASAPLPGTGPRMRTPPALGSQVSGGPGAGARGALAARTWLGPARGPGFRAPGSWRSADLAWEVGLPEPFRSAAGRSRCQVRGWRLLPQRSLRKCFWWAGKGACFLGRLRGNPTARPTSARSAPTLLPLRDRRGPQRRTLGRVPEGAERREVFL
ncbi:hypothetical protein H8959_017176 [Pygathrix nigripes]